MPLNLKLIYKIKYFDIGKEAKKLGVILDCKPAELVYGLHITEKIKDLAENLEIQPCENIINVLSIANRLGLKPSLADSQNFYFNSVFNKIPELIESLKRSENMQLDKKFIATFLNLGERLDFNVEKYYNELNKLASKIESR